MNRHAAKNATRQRLFVGDYNIMNILITNAHSTHNAGDYAILRESLRQVYDVFPDATVTVLTNDPRNYIQSYQEEMVPSLWTWIITNKDGRFQMSRVRLIIGLTTFIAACLIYRLTGKRCYFTTEPHKQNMLDAYFEADLVLAIGGGYLYGNKYANTWFTMLWLMAFAARILDTPLFLLPQSIGPLATGWQKWLTRMLVHAAHLTMVREARSKQVLEKLGIWYKVEEVPDLAFGLEPSYTAIIPQLTAPASFRVGMTLLNWQEYGDTSFDQHGYEQSMLALINHITQQGGQVVLFTQVSGPTAPEDDRRIAQAVVQQVQHPKNVLFLDQMNLDDLLAAYRHMDFFIGTRMHSAIFALTGGVPVLVVGYLHKSIGIMEALGLQKYCIPIETVTADNLIQQFDYLYAERDAVAAIIAEKIPQWRQHTQATVARVRELL